MYELIEPDRTRPSQADEGSYQANTESSEANARSSQADGAPFGPKEDPLRLTENHRARAIQIDKGLSQTDKGLTSDHLSQIWFP